MSSKLFITTQQAAQELGVTDSRVRQLIATGAAKPKQRIGNSWVFTLAEVKRLYLKRKAGRKG